MAHRNRWFTELKNGWIFHGYGTNNQRVILCLYMLILSKYYVDHDIGSSGTWMGILVDPLMVILMIDDYPFVNQC